MKNLYNKNNLQILLSINLIIYNKLIDVLNRTNNVTKHEENITGNNKIKVYACDNYQAELNVVTDWIKAKQNQNGLYVHGQLYMCVFLRRKSFVKTKQSQASKGL